MSYENTEQRLHTVKNYHSKPKCSRFHVFLSDKRERDGERETCWLGTVTACAGTLTNVSFSNHNDSLSTSLRFTRVQSIMHAHKDTVPPADMFWQPCGTQMHQPSSRIARTAPPESRQISRCTSNGYRKPAHTHTYIYIRIYGNGCDECLVAFFPTFSDNLITIEFINTIHE